MNSHVFTVGVNLSSKEQHFSVTCDGPKLTLRRQQIEDLWDDNCKAAGVAVWSPLALNFAEHIASGGLPVPYEPDEIVIDSENPHVEYAQMLIVERHRFPAANLYPADSELFERGLALVREDQGVVIADVEESLRMDGVLLENWQLELNPQRPLADMDTLTANYDGKSVEFNSLNQFRLFHLLAQTPGKYVEYLTVAEKVWGDDMTSNKTIQNTLTLVRRILAAAGIVGIKFESPSGRVRMLLS